jgi:RNA polymerase sigma-70 factor (ECF subfamily)
LKPEPDFNDNINGEPGLKHSSIALGSLVSRCVHGDRKAQSELFNQYKDTVFSLVARTLGPGFDYDDVAQQVFISLFRSLRHFQGLSSLNTWVYRITSKVCTDQLRKKYRKRKILIAESTEENDKAFDEIGDNSTPHSNLEHIELSKKVYEALNQISVEKRIVTIMFEMEGRTLEEIAEIVKKPVGTVKSRLFHARKELARHLKQYIGKDLE